ncbi:hypothetical protein PR202_gb09054 [Eleusine coracana subsp. coracana]|uniref:Uncharacterized protein n=1 Tax=Eleusine coracana subsp. coracana TaxID=191504 RepID=A0AAV5EGA7_ELECO|nr:hypothetical protein PR202_gb09054 [Eleusine coracana subsp. coracana]
MVEDGAADKDQEVRQLEDRLREVGERLKTPPDAAEDLLKLLTDVEECLLKVEQSPAESTSIAIQPATDALVKKELLGHVDPNVRLAVASCISEITRITAPNAPYEDDEMKDVFTVIVGSFEHLDKIDSPFFGRRASILDTVAKVRSCVVMLDLECDDLILDMFRHFIRTVSPEHSEAVRSCMETIMKLVIEESEDVQPQIASCLLENVRKEDKESSSPSFVLAEKVIGMCREKLKPVFLPLLKDTSLSEYSQIVTSVCEEGSDDKEDNNADPVKDTVDDGKLSERTISDELPQEPDKIEQDVSRPEQDGTSMNGTPGNALSSDAAPADNGAESIAEEPKKPSPPLTDQTKLDPSDKSEVILAETKKEGPTSSVEAANGAADETSGPAAVTPVKRRGRPPGQKSLEKKAAGKNQPSSDVEKIEEATDSVKLKKQSVKDDVKSSVKKAGEGESSKKQQKISSKQEKNETLSEEEDPFQRSEPKGNVSSSLFFLSDILFTTKEMVSTKSLTKGPGRPKGQSVENNKQSAEKSISKRKGEQETEETPQTRKTKGLDSSLLGARIKVWWPDDKAFYKGVVESYDAASKRHKACTLYHLYSLPEIKFMVAYDDGDVEVLLLRNEKWEFISEGKEAPVASDTPRGRKRKGSSVQPAKEEKPETPKSDGGEVPKKRGRPKGSGNGTSSNKSYTTPSSKGKAESKDVKETPKTATNMKKELEKSSKDKAARSTDEKDGLPKDGDKSGSKSKEAGSKGKDSKDEIKSTEGKGRPGRKPKRASTPVESDTDKEKQEKESKTAEIEQEASANASTGKKRRRKA